MAEVTVSERVPIEREKAWALMSDLSRLDEWLALHEGWRSAVPRELTVGTELVSVVSLKGVRNRVTWAVEQLRPPELIVLAGDGKGGTRASLRFEAAAAGDETEIRLHADFSNPALVGPFGGVVARSLKGELRTSIARLVELA